ncbi:MAG: site-specific integrase [Microbacterium sp. 69-10]|uniref:tyrosine-type recombinase/integrase n=1 Tax=Microbacterium sp. 69-10 TaxID=1895783 RepID=UPI00095D732E|nr:site-specific integrase [Microbacterium sp. 69-10]OJU41521.1 MAG: site-specific integrase [Microbacterium sp. 69-10]
MPRKADPLPQAAPKPVPPIGVKVSTDMERRSYGIRARARWTDPISKRRVTRSEIVPDEAAAHAFFDQLRTSSSKGMDVSMTLLEFVTSIGQRWARGLDPTSTADNYGIGLRLRVLPALGHLPVSQITAGIIDRTIDEWETRHGASTIKNTIAPLVRILDEAVRDGMLTTNPAKNRAKRSLNRNAFREQSAEDASPRAHAIPDLATLNKLAGACAEVHQSYSDFVMLAALLAARSSEVSGLQAGDVRFDKNIVIISRQTFPGKGGLITKATKNRKERRVPILDPLRPVLERLTEGKEPENRLLVGPKGGVLTTATVRDATNWDELVAKLDLPNLTRHGLRHTGATWMADAGVPLHVLQDILGHASIETTRGYLHPDDRHLASAAEQANAFLRKSGRPASKQPASRRTTARGL